MEEELMKYAYPIIIMITAAVTAVFTFLSSKQDSDQKDRIEELGKINKDLSKNIEELSDINIALSTKIDSTTEQGLSITKEVKTLGVENKNLSEQVLELSKVVRDLNTGGSSFISMRSVNLSVYENGSNPNANFSVTFEFRNLGDFALDNVKIRCFETDYANSNSIWSDISRAELNTYSFFPRRHMTSADHIILSKDYEVLKPKQVFFETLDFKNSFSSYGLNIIIESKRQDWVMLLRLDQPNLKDYSIKKAIKVFSLNADGLKGIYESVDLGFPKSNKGEVLWFKNNLPDNKIIW